MIVKNSFTFTNDGTEKNKERLIEVFKLYQENKADPFRVIDDKWKKETVLKEFNKKHGLSWPTDQNEFLEDYLTCLDENQAIEFTGYLNEYIPKFLGEK